mmetsp:Transcript_125538/g.349474  ORF Transcript_125538/g.349474 Transcript_125538/m.349474 type:complete len:238 (-) Transcript_125538:716-1429(-)
MTKSIGSAMLCSMARLTSLAPPVRSAGICPFMFSALAQSGCAIASRLATSACPARAATCKGVSPIVSWKSSRASSDSVRPSPGQVAFSNVRTTSVWPLCAAMCSAVQQRRIKGRQMLRMGLLSPNILTSTRAPSWSSCWQISSWPLAAASMSGVFPSMSKMLMFRPTAALFVSSRMAHRMAVTSPLAHAEKMSAVRAWCRCVAVEVTHQRRIQYMGMHSKATAFMIPCISQLACSSS